MSPTPLLLVLVATLHAALAHVVVGKNILQLPIYWLAALVGAVVVYATGFSLGSGLPAPSGVHLVEISVGAWIALSLAMRATNT
jgi:hypothetical protein